MAWCGLVSLNQTFPWLVVGSPIYLPQKGQPPTGSPGCLPWHYRAWSAGPRKSVHSLLSQPGPCGQIDGLPHLHGRLPSLEQKTVPEEFRVLGKFQGFPSQAPVSFRPSPA